MNEKKIKTNFACSFHNFCKSTDSLPDLGLNKQIVIVKVIIQNGRIETKKLLIK